MPEIEQIMENQQQPQYVVPAAVAAENALFGKYELGKLLGCGAFAKVYHARNVGTGQSVAIKIINKKRLSGTSLMSNIKREITIMRRLRHANIVKLYEVMASKTKIYFVIEFVKGGELFAKVSKGRFSEDLSRKYFQQLISAVSYCHSRGIFHRDLKPENLLMDENGDLKVTDFGLSAVTDQIRPDGLLHTLCGTPAYVAPEILTKKGYDGAKIDVWSCGVILFVLNAGYLPFNDPNLMAMYKKIYKGDFRCPKWFSPELRCFLYRLLDTNPLTRITVDDILKDPWFKKGGLRALNAIEYDYSDKMEEKDEESMKGVKGLNAFDLISFSPSLDLSGLFDNSFNSVDDSERLVLSVVPEKIMNAIEEFAKAEKLRVKKKKEFGVELQCKDGSLVIEIEVYRLTDNLVVVEAKRKGGDAGVYKQVWNNKLKPFVSQVITSASASASASTSASASASTSQVVAEKMTFYES